MTPPIPPTKLQDLVNRLARGDRSAALALHALICAADRTGTASFNDVAVQYRNDHLAALRSQATPIVARVREGRTYLDLRSVDPGEDEIVVAALTDLAR